jgi:hypothetical protein
VTAKESAEFLLADMRRKYLHALNAETKETGLWLRGDPITAMILEQWIPQLEQIVQQMGETNE